MFCPNPECPDVVASGVAGEYREGIVACPVCGADLVAADPRLQPSGSAAGGDAGLVGSRPVEAVVETADPAELDIVRSILEGAGIPYAVEGSEPRAAYRAGHALHRFDPLFGGLRFLVPSECAAEARALLTEIDEGADDAAPIDPV